jgi:hypothetical protein
MLKKLLLTDEKISLLEKQQQLQIQKIAYMEKMYERNKVRQVEKIEAGIRAYILEIMQ